MDIASNAGAQEEAIAALARQLLEGKIGVCFGSRQIRDLAFKTYCDPWTYESLKTFLIVDTETDHLPLGEERSGWQPAALIEKDEEIATCDALFREQVLSAAGQLLESRK